MKTQTALFRLLSVLIISVLLLTGCAPSAPLDTKENENAPSAPLDTEEYGNKELEVFNQQVEIIHKNETGVPMSSLEGIYVAEPNPGGFGMALTGGSGTFARGGDFFFLYVDLINNTNTSYKWKGDSTGFNVQADLVCIQDGREIAKVQGVYKSTADISHCEVKPGESDSRAFRFYLPEDAPAGDYTLVCRFHSTTIRFEGFFRLE